MKQHLVEALFIIIPILFELIAVGLFLFGAGVWAGVLALAI